MSEEKTHAIIGLLRKAVGLPATKSSCCGAPPEEERPESAECCGEET